MSRFRNSLTRVRVAAAGVGILGALAVAVPATANASSPVTLDRGASVMFPTWSFGMSTQVCATNQGTGYSYARVDPFPYGDGIYDMLYVPSRGSNCELGNWWGNPIQVTNLGGNPLRVYTA
jgi:hypothetical protein